MWTRHQLYWRVCWAGWFECIVFCTSNFYSMGIERLLKYIKYELLTLSNWSWYLIKHFLILFNEHSLIIAWSGGTGSIRWIYLKWVYDFGMFSSWLRIKDVKDETINKLFSVNLFECENTLNCIKSVKCNRIKLITSLWKKFC